MIDPTLPLPTQTQKQSVFNRQANGTFGKGNIANPMGAPKKDWTFKDLLLEVAEEYHTITKKDGTSERMQMKKMIVKKLFNKAIQGDIQAIKELLNRVDGMPRQQMDMNLGGGLTVVLKRDNE